MPTELDKKKNIMYCFSSLLTENKKYRAAANRLFRALDERHVDYRLLEHTRDIWLRDFMPVKTRSGSYVSFRYEPSYLIDNPGLRTDFKTEIAPQLQLERLIYSDINLDGGNIVFSPSKNTAVVSDRVFSENPDIQPNALISELERLLEAQIIIIPSLRSDMTGHADGMVRFLDERTALGNSSPYKFGLEARIKSVLKKCGIETYDFPYFDSSKDSAVGCYLNYLDAGDFVFLPYFGVDEDEKAAACAEKLFSKPVVPVNIREIAVDGGCLNCISWKF